MRPFVAAEPGHEERARLGGGDGADVEDGGDGAHALHRRDAQPELEREHLARSDDDEERRTGCAEGVVQQPGRRPPEEGDRGHPAERAQGKH